MSELRLANATTLMEANDVLSEFLPRYNRRFGVPAAQAGSAYRMPDAGLDIDGVLCIKERRRVARDNTVQYHGRTLQLFPHTDRPSYAGARVEVQERLDGRILVSYRGTVLTPQEAPPLAASLSRLLKKVGSVANNKLSRMLELGQSRRRRLPCVATPRDRPLC